jgi:hypothetical protein
MAIMMKRSPNVFEETVKRVQEEIRDLMLNQQATRQWSPRLVTRNAQWLFGVIISHQLFRGTEYQGTLLPCARPEWYESVTTWPVPKVTFEVDDDIKDRLEYKLVFKAIETEDYWVAEGDEVDFVLGNCGDGHDGFAQSVRSSAYNALFSKVQRVLPNTHLMIGERNMCGCVRADPHDVKCRFCQNLDAVDFHNLREFGVRMCAANFVLMNNKDFPHRCVMMSVVLMTVGTSNSVPLILKR